MSESHPFLYFELLPMPALRPWVQAYWGFDVRRSGPVSEAHHTVWPDGTLSLLVRFRSGETARAGYSGPRVQPLRITVAEGDCYRGVRLWPWAIRPLLGIDPARVRDRSGPAMELLDNGAAAALAAPASPGEAYPALEGVLLERVPNAAAPDPAVRDAVEAIAAADGASRIADIARSARLSDRQLRRRFRTATGLSPKEFARVRRLRAAAEARLTDGTGWSTLAARFGFADQAHLVREMGRMTGLTPTALEDRLARIEHRDVRA